MILSGDAAVEEMGAKTLGFCGGREDAPGAQCIASLSKEKIAKIVYYFID